MPPIGTTSRELRVATPGGHIQVQRWDCRAGDDPVRAPIVLFHDSLGCLALWRDFPSRLAEATARPVLAYDRLGFGRSDRHPGRLQPDFVTGEAAGAFAVLKAELAIGHFIALGHSVGGGMAAACAAAFPADCLGLVTLSAQAFVEERTLAGIRAAQADFCKPGGLERLARHHGDKAPWVLEAWTGTWLSAAFRDWNLDATLAQLRCPLLAIHGERDEYGSQEHPRRIAARAGGGARTLMLAGCGHLPHRERETEVLEAVGQFCRAAAT